MPVFTVEKSILINAPIDQVYSAVRDFTVWREWSPWLIAEPEAVVNYLKNPDGYTWEGQVTGSGKFHLIEETAPRSMRCHLEFIKPWKSVCETRFSFSETSEGTEVTWTMDGSLPFFMFFMKKSMVAYVGADYARGLVMLKDYVELGNVPCKLEFPGTTAFKGGLYIGVKAEGSPEDISTLARGSFETLQSWRKQTGTELRDQPFAIYHKWDLVKGKVSFSTGFPLSTRPAEVPDGLFIGELPDVAVYPVRHTGPYRHIANAWSAGIMHGRGKKFCQGKQLHPFEIYEVMRDEVEHENDLVTVVNFPVK